VLLRNVNRILTTNNSNNCAVFMRDSVVYISREVKDTSVPVYGYRYFVYQFLFMSACLPVISTRFPAVNHGLHVKDKRVRELVNFFHWFSYHGISLGFLKLQTRFTDKGTCISAPIPVNQNRGI
jgi:hypothetical protein